MSAVDLESLGLLSEIFERLRLGRHLCPDDGPLYLALRSDYESYRAIFDALGFTLVQHEREFYYFQSGDDLGKEAASLVVFFFVLIEAWGDNHEDLEMTAFALEGHALAELPHLTRESWRRCMAEANVSSQHDLEAVVTKMARYGFIERIGDDRFRFRAPAWRFFDLCLDVWQETEEAKQGESEEVDA